MVGLLKWALVKLETKKEIEKENYFKYQIIVCGWFAKVGTHGQEALRTKAAFIARVWIGLDSPPISLTIVHNAFNKNTRIQKVRMYLYILSILLYVSLFLDKVTT